MHDMGWARAGPISCTKRWSMHEDGRARGGPTSCLERWSMRGAGWAQGGPTSCVGLAHACSFLGPGRAGITRRAVVYVSKLVGPGEGRHHA